MRTITKRTFAQSARSLAALMLAVCMLISLVPSAFAGEQVGSKPSSLWSSSAKAYIKLSKSVQFFTGTTYGTGTKIYPPVGGVYQLYTDNWYTASDGLNYHSVYYLNERYNVLRSDIVGDIMTDAQLDDYIRNTLWKQTTYTTLRESMDIEGDVRVHAVQLALKQLGYYSGNLDGEYGEETNDAVARFQRAQGLDADGSAGPLTQPILFSLASGGTVSGSTSSSTSTSTSGTTGTLRTNVVVNLRKNATTSSQKLAAVPKAVNLAYSATYTSRGVTWYYVRYNGLQGWLMGTFVTVKSASGGTVSGSASSTATPIGTVTITKGGTRVRDGANGNKTGVLLSKGTVVSLLAQPVSAGGYTWYNIRTGNGLVGFVRGDCATASIGGTVSGGTTGGGTSSGGASSDVILSSGKNFIKLPATTELFRTDTKPSSGTTKVSAGTVLMLESNTTYTKDNVEYCSFYYNNKKHNAVYSDVKSGLMSASEVEAYVKTLLTSSLPSSLKRTQNLTGDVRVYALQSGLKTLGYYTGNLDGTYGIGTYTAVRNFQRACKISVDGSCGVVTWQTLAAKLYGTGSSGGSVDTDNSVTVTDFGTVTSVQKMSWDYGDNGGETFPKGTYATIMDVETGKCFRIYRWSGGSHADCVPASTADTKTMCDIVGFPYNSNHPSSSQLSKIKADGDKGIVTYTWPDFKNAFGGAKNIGSAWDRRAALININGKVYPVSIYGFPHGFNGSDSFSKSKFPNGQYFYAANNYYGMMCVHFTGSTTHSSTTPDEKHQANIDKAYNYAKQMWPTLVK